MTDCVSCKVCGACHDSGVVYGCRKCELSSQRRHRGNLAVLGHEANLLKDRKERDDRYGCSNASIVDITCICFYRTIRRYPQISNRISRLGLGRNYGTKDCAEKYQNSSGDLKREQISHGRPLLWIALQRKDPLMSYRIRTRRARIYVRVR